jgi:hypothetical protein
VDTAWKQECKRVPQPASTHRLTLTGCGRSWEFGIRYF